MFGVPKEAEMLKELKFVVKLLCFSAKFTIFGHFGKFFALYSILAEKQHNLTTNVSSLSFSASFGTPNVTS